MSEVKGALLTLILTIVLFTTVYGILKSTIFKKANQVAEQIEGIPVTAEYFAPAAGGAAPVAAAD